MKTKHIHIAYGLTALLLLFMSLFTGATFDIALHDTYVVIPNWHIFIVLSFLFGLYFIVAYLLYKNSRAMRKVLGLIHWSITVLGLITSALLVKNIINETPRRYYDYSVYDPENTYSNSTDLNYVLGIVLIITLIAQLLFVLNLVLALTKKE
ncbi:hypothetical protein K6119_07980 [Paracrocinitomix mangrovi]|uniref:hypothetical protein n=1 Tax=Paracrocinitomix mangrovi TaxID=2862509 RepID=UPI001EDA343B|nr:hypothetical protein [Paracrocinitomix mangrovi]UKN00197.1 hypothetical protein K6119_10680 [Paracrocinitomix mangrovi]UKN00211.1 hypothetical protein K6119_10750 [Paracrocinitomix mangrovi]UKN03443.1 hypothetical protein K6119_07945 [Paracrocinitomix mangrovi]UKN03450.1 hypothetical protein K6119_07980 [Paracrocinitomix mangrovi]